MKKRVLLGTTAVAAVAMMVTAGPASAFHCYNNSRSAQGNAAAAGAAPLVSLEEILTQPEFEIELCPAGVDFVLDGLAEEEGINSGMLINFRTTMAQGLQKVQGEFTDGDKSKQGLLSNDKGIDHIEESEFAIFDTLIGQVYGQGICPAPTPV